MKNTIKIQKQKYKKYTTRNKKGKKHSFKNHNRKNERFTRKQMRGGGLRYGLPDDLYTPEQFWETITIGQDSLEKLSCVDLLLTKNSPKLPTVVSLSGKYTGLNYNKCKLSMQLFNTQLFPFEEYLAYRRIVKYFYEREQMFNETNQAYRKHTMLGEKKQIEKLGSVYIIMYVIELYLKKDQAKLEDLLLKIHPNFYIFLLDSNNYENINKLQQSLNYRWFFLTGRKIESVVDWIYNTNNSMRVLKTPEDLIRMFTGFYPIEAEHKSFVEDVYIDQYIANVSTNETSQFRYDRPDNNWDISFDVKIFSFSKILNFLNKGGDADINELGLTQYNVLWVESFVRRYKTIFVYNNETLVFKDAEAFISFNPSETYEERLLQTQEERTVMALNQYNNLMKILTKVYNEKRETAVVYNDINALEMTSSSTKDVSKDVSELDSHLQQFFSSLPDTSFFTRIGHIFIYLFSATTVFFGSIFQEKYSNLYGLFHQYKKMYTQESNFVVSAKNKIEKNKEVEMCVKEFVSKHLPNFDYETLILNPDNKEQNDKEGTSQLPRLRIIDFDKNFAHSVQCAQLLSHENLTNVGLAVTIVSMYDIFGDDPKINIHCLILWNKNEDSDLIQRENSVLYDGFFHPIFKSLSTETDAEQDIQAMKSANPEFWKEMEKPDGG